MSQLPRAILVASAVLSPGSVLAAFPAVGTHYVSMGSSYAAGPGVGRPDPGGGRCGRSTSNYARPIARRHHFDLVDVACSGATSTNILAQGQFGFPAQIEAIDADTQLVTILIGGNDVAYVPNLVKLTCRDLEGEDCRAATLDAEVDRRLAALPGRLRSVLAAVRARAPKARIVLVGYLPVIPAAGPGVCEALPLSPADAARMRSVAVRLAQVIGGVAATTGTRVVRSSLIGHGHDACSTTPFVAGAHPGRNPGWPSPVPYHPNQAGMDQIAAAIDRVLDEFPAPSE